MAESPAVLISKSVLWLRAHDKKLAKSMGHSKYKTPWELDWIRLRWRDKAEPLPEKMFGRRVVLTGDPSVKPTDCPVIDIGDILILQFVPENDLDFILKVYETFGRMALVRLTDKQLDGLVEYCNKMDDRILIASKKLQESGVKDIFNMMWREMGGEMIRQDDLLGRRIAYYREIVSRFKADRASYQPEITRLKLLS